MSSKIKRKYISLSILMCFVVVLNYVTVCFASVLVKSYFRHIDTYAVGYDEYLFATNHSDYNSTYSDKSSYYTVYIPEGQRVALREYSGNYMIYTGDKTFYVYGKDVYYKNGAVDNMYDVLGTSYTKYNISKGSDITILYNQFYIFDNDDDLIEYIETGDTEGAVGVPSKDYDADNIYLENFRAIYHDSNILENCYVEFKYDLPQYIKDNVENAYLSMSCSYDADFELLASLVDINAFDFSFVENISLNDYPTGFDFYISDYITDKDIYNYYSQMMLGDEFYIDFDGLSIDGIGGNTIAQITKSTMYFNFTPCIGSFCGLQYDAQVDLLNPSNTTYHSSTPDDSGNYTSNNDYTQSDGYYTTIVGTDGQGNPTYNYYYYDNSTHTTVTLDPDFDTDVDVGVGGDTIPEGSDVLTILWGNALTVNGSLGDSVPGGAGGSGGDVTINGSGDNIDITIEDDDYTDSSLREDLRDGFGLLDNMDTDESSDGFLQLSAKFYEHLDGDLDDMLVFGMASVVVISILRSALRR